MGKLEVKNYTCPSCGFPITGGTKKGTIICPQCGNPVTIDEATTKEANQYQVDDHSLRISFGNGSNQNPAAILVYLEDYLEKERDYVKNEFEEVGIAELNDVIEELKMTHGDKAELWKLAFISISEPARIRLENLESFTKEMVEAAEDKDEDKVYSLFDNYKSGIRDLKKHEEEVFLDLERYLNRFEKMNGSSSDIRLLKEKKASLENSYKALPENIETINDIPMFKDVKEKLDQQISNSLFEKGIDANEYYESAIADKDKGDAATALHKLSILGDYKDSPKIRLELRRYTEVGDDCLIVGGKPVLAIDHTVTMEELNGKHTQKAKKKKGEEEEKEVRSGSGFDLINIVNGEPDYKNPLIKDYVKCLSIFGNLFYYLSRNGKIHSYDVNKLSDRELESDGNHYEKTFYLRYEEGTKGLLLSRSLSANERKVEPEPRFKKGEEVEVHPSGTNACRLLMLNFGSDETFVKTLIDRIDGVEPFQDGKYVKNDFINIYRYHYFKTKINKKEFSQRTAKERILLNIKTGQEYVDFIDQDEHFITVIDNEVFFIRYANTKYNLSLVKKNLETLEEEIILTNAFHIIDVKDDDVFYTIGNTDKEALCNYDMVTGEKHVVFDRYQGFADHFGGYFYLYRGDKYNKTLFKIKDDGSSSMILARNIDLDDGKFRRFKDGYFYYENIFGELCVVRIDGTKHKVLAHDLERVLKVESNTIYYSCQETTDKLYMDEASNSGVKFRKALSIYRYNINEHGSEKILFAVDCWSYDGADTLYYTRINDEEYRSTNMKKGRNFEVQTTLEVYRKMRLSTLEEEDMFTIGLPHQEKQKEGCSLIWWLFHRKDDRNIEFKKLSWIRPYLTNKRADERRD